MSERFRRVVLESPYGGDVERNKRYARACVRDCLQRGESAIASHLLYTQEGILDDAVPAERMLGIRAGWAWMPVADAVVVYTDLGTSDGMREGIRTAARLGCLIEYRSLKEWASD